MIKQDMSIYAENNQNIDLPIAKMKIKLDYDRSWSSKYSSVWSPYVEMYTARSSVAGNNGYNATYDSSKKEITIEYSNPNNVRNVSSQTLCSFTLVYKTDIPRDERLLEGIFDGEADLGEMRYTTKIQSIECYDKDGNNITRNLDLKGQEIETKVKYKADKSDVRKRAWLGLTGSFLLGGL